MPTYTRLETGKLADVDETYHYGAYCRACKHHARLDLLKLRDHLGPDFPLVDIRKRLRCGRCRSRQVTIAFLSPDMMLGNVVAFKPAPRDLPKD